MGAYSTESLGYPPCSKLTIRVGIWPGKKKRLSSSPSFKPSQSPHKRMLNAENTRKPKYKRPRSHGKVCDEAILQNSQKPKRGKIAPFGRQDSVRHADASTSTGGDGDCRRQLHCPLLYRSVLSPSPSQGDRNRRPWSLCILPPTSSWVSSTTVT